MNWNKKDKGVYELNLANVIVLKVVYYENFGWKGSIQGAFFTSLNTIFYELEDAQKATIETAKHMLYVASCKLGE